jgi:hypothetical protein
LILLNWIMDEVVDAILGQELNLHETDLKTSEIA